MLLIDLFVRERRWEMRFELLCSTGSIDKLDYEIGLEKRGCFDAINGGTC